MLENGQVMFLFPRADQVPSVTAKVDGKEVRALGLDRKPSRPSMSLPVRLGASAGDILQDQAIRENEAGAEGFLE